MNPVPRPMVYTAGAALAAVCVLGLYLGIQPSLEHTTDEDQATAASSAPTPGAAAAVQAVPLKTELPPPSAAPAASSTPSAQQLAQATRPRPSAASVAPSSDITPVLPNRAPEPPPLYSPDEGPAPAPPGENSNNTPPY